MFFRKKRNGGTERSVPDIGDIGDILERALPANLRFPQFYLTASVRIRGDVDVDSHAHVEGTIEGSVRVGDRTLTIARKGIVEGDVHGAVVLVHGQLSGDVHASERVEIAAGARVEGDLYSPNVVLAQGAAFKGRVNPQPESPPLSAPRSWPPQRDGRKGRRPTPPTWSAAGAPVP